MNLIENERSESVHSPDYPAAPISITHDSQDPYLPMANPFTSTSAVPGTYGNTMIPAYFPGLNPYESRENQ